VELLSPEAGSDGSERTGRAFATSTQLLSRQLEVIRKHAFKLAGRARSLPVLETRVLTSPDPLRGFGEIACRISPDLRVYVILSGEAFLPSFVFDLETRRIYYNRTVRATLDRMIEAFMWLADKVPADSPAPIKGKKGTKVLLNGYDYTSHYFYNGLAAIDFLSADAKLPKKAAIEFHGTDFIDIEGGFEKVWANWQLPKVDFLPTPPPPTDLDGDITLPLSGLGLSHALSERCKAYLLSAATRSMKGFVDLVLRRNELIFVLCHRVDEELIRDTREVLDVISEQLDRRGLVATLFVYRFGSVKRQAGPILRALRKGAVNNFPEYRNSRLRIVDLQSISFPDAGFLFSASHVALAMNSPDAALPLITCERQVVLLNRDEVRYDARAYHEKVDCTVHDVQCRRVDPGYAHSDHEVPRAGFEKAIGSALDALN